MPYPVKFRFTPSNQALPLIPKSIKLLIAILTITLSIYSGKVDFLNDMVKRNNTILTAESAYYSSKSTADLKSKSKIIQIKQVAIGQKEYIYPTATPTLAVDTTSPWGVSKKLDEHTYTMKVQPDSKMGSEQDILNALNNYRQRHGSGALSWDNALADFAKTRVEYFAQINNLDGHKGFLEFLNNQDGFKKLGFGAVGENSSLGFTLEGTHLIEWVYAGDKAHDDNQLSNQWQYVGIGVKGNATDLVFAASKM